ncbi:MAG: hypothetical protein M3421_05850 [Bacteroidota bacterium]|nr:hypothetical protein [Bacteroidota bacterium]
MNHKLDKLFKGKLAEQEVTPSPLVWNKLHAELKRKKKHKFLLFYKVAAILLLLFISTITIISINNNTNPNISGKGEITENAPALDSKKGLSENMLSVPQKEDEISKIEESLRDLDALHLSENKDQGIIIKQKKQISSQQTTIKEKVKEHIPPFDLETLPESEDLLLADKESIIQKNGNEQQVSTVITITYKRGVKSNEIIAANTPDSDQNISEKEKTALKRILNLAREIKSEISLAELRDSKEDLFALEIIKQKNN